MAIRILGDGLYDIRIVLTMDNIIFANLQVHIYIYICLVEKLARESFFFLGESFPHNSVSFVSYVFDLHPPTDTQFGEYTLLAFTKSLHNQ
ncbi:unnamed protein product [Brassica oleracea var. botrytis]